MINEKEINISNQSYTKKDFYQIYPEILDLATKMSNRWDPQSSNESDPGVVLLKLLAFVADKNNYIIDKSILEAFMPSATQEDSMRKLCSMMGYEVDYYKSATANVTIAYRGQLDEEGNEKLGEINDNNSIQLPIFTNITSADDDINYFTTEPQILTLEEKEISVPCMEGECIDVQVGQSNIVTLDNIDDLHRFYLPESMIAENGIFIKNVNSSSNEWNEWEKVSNLNAHEARKQCYKFGFDSRKQLPYIEFPDDIDELIKDGLYIKYTRTTGINGNISPKVLIKFKDNKLYTSNGKEINLSTDEEKKSIYINNPSAATNGANSESIDSAYNSFKKQVGTFNTLVTVRDYANAIYNLVDSLGTSIISNVQVADIRDDLNKTTQVVTYNDFGLNTELHVDNINTFDLYIYPLGGSFTYYDKNNYKSSFKLASSKKVDILNGIEENKTMSHVCKLPGEDDPDDLVCFKGVYNLRAKITTTYKVTSSEESQILNNIYFRLYEDFNARKVDFGEEIPYESILNSIKNADVRIKEVYLEEPTINIEYLAANGDQEPLFYNEDGSVVSDRSRYLNLLANNILAGKISLFKFITDFNLNYGESADTIIGSLNTTVNKKLIELKTVLDITTPIEGDNTPITLGPNQVIQFLAPNYRSSITYPGYVNYFWVADPEAIVSKDSEHEITESESLYILYTDSNDEVQALKYTKDGVYINNSTSPKAWSGIIKPNFDLKDSQTVKTQSGAYWDKTTGIPTNYTQWTDLNGKGMFQLDTNQQIDIRERVYSELKGRNSYYFYWIVNELDNDLSKKFNGQNSYILQEGEYIFYTDINKVDLVILGSGTEIELDNISASSFGPLENKVSLDNIDDKGLAAFKDDNWELIQLSTENNKIIFKENKIITLTQGDVLSYAEYNNAGIDLVDSEENVFKPLTKAEYQLQSEDSPHSISSESVLEWSIRGRLDLNIGPNLYQKLEAATDKVYYKYENESDFETTPISNINIKCNEVLQVPGSSNIDIRIKKLNPNTGESEYINTLNILTFGYTEPKYHKSGSDVEGTSLSVNSLIGRYTVLNLSEVYQAIVDVSVLPGSKSLIMFYYLKDKSLEPGSGVSYPSISTTGNYLKIYNEESGNLRSSITLENTGVYTIEVDQTCTVTISRGSDTRGKIIFDTISSVDSDNDGVNMELLSITGSEKNSLLSKLRVYNNSFYYTNPLHNTAGSIDVTTMASPEAMYDYNNIYNKFIISELNVEKFESGITLTKASRK